MPTPGACLAHPSSGQSFFQIFSGLRFPSAPREKSGRYRHTHFTHEETEAQRRSPACVPRTPAISIETMARYQRSSQRDPESSPRTGGRLLYPAPGAGCSEGVLLQGPGPRGPRDGLVCGHPLCPPAPSCPGEGARSSESWDAGSPRHTSAHRPGRAGPGRREGSRAQNNCPESACSGPGGRPKRHFPQVSRG